MEPQEQIEQKENNVKKPSAISTPAAIITAGVIIAAALIFKGGGTKTISNIKDQQKIAPTEKVSLRENDYVRGDISKAEVVVIEYSDSDCPFCERFHTTMKDLLSQYGTKVAWAYRYFPLSIHPNANNEAIALECVGSLGGNDAFWKYLDEVISITVSPEKSKATLSSVANGIGIDKNLFESCIANPDIAKKITDQSTEAQSLGAQGTPYSIAINKKGEQEVIPGALPIEQLKPIIDRLLK
ncbi:thioredoxin domain-containing protein [Candidatus Nomurabacteria bacterium]|nr:thioredoxin domain-containing protein [Candidatus Nomurabacteria bacterium]